MKVGATTIKQRRLARPATEKDNMMGETPRGFKIDVEKVLLFSLSTEHFGEKELVQLLQEMCCQMEGLKSK